jgi:hypothetical protein
MNNDYIFVIIKAGDCGVCTGRLEPLMPIFHKRFKDESIDIVEYKIEKMRINLDRNGKVVYPEVLGLVWWYPFMFFIKKDHWEDIKKGIDRRDKMHIINGTVGENGQYNLEKDEKKMIAFLDPNSVVNHLKKIISPVVPPKRAVEVESNPFLLDSNKKKNVVEHKYCNFKVVPKDGRS